MKNIDIIGIQMDLGAVRKGVDMGPLAIRHTGLVKEIRNLGIEVRDKGDIVLLPAIEEGNPKMRYEKIIYEANNRLYQENLWIMKIALT
jgi:arginase